MGGPAVDGWSSPRDDSPSSAVRMAPPVARPGWGPLPAVAPTALLTVEDCVSSMVWLYPSGVSWKSVCDVCGCPRDVRGRLVRRRELLMHPYPTGRTRTVRCAPARLKSVGLHANRSQSRFGYPTCARLPQCSQYPTTGTPEVPVVPTTDAFCPPSRVR